jgi:hypothetical protein
VTVPPSRPPVTPPGCPGGSGVSRETTMINDHDPEPGSLRPQSQIEGTFVPVYESRGQATGETIMVAGIPTHSPL